MDDFEPFDPCCPDDWIEAVRELTGLLRDVTDGYRSERQKPELMSFRVERAEAALPKYESWLEENLL